VVAEAQKAGGTALYIDAEHALGPAYAAACGIKMDELLISQPDYGEQALETTEAVLRSGAIDLVVIDSIADLVPKAEIKGDIGEPHIGLQARLMSQGLRKLCGVISANRAAVIFINQIEEKIGILHGSSETTPGGRALKFYATVRIDLRIREAIKQGNGRIGNIVNATVVKNKVAPPFREAQFEVLFGHGIGHEVEILDLGNEIGILNLSGHYYQWEKQILGQKREAARKYLQQHTYVARQIESLIRTKNLPLASESREKSEDQILELAIA
jgi:recombination protein RecA